MKNIISRYTVNKKSIKIRSKISYAIILTTVLNTTTLFSQEFGSRIDMGTIESDEITEASGIEASSKNPGVFWTFNDSGGENKIYAFSSTGKDLGSYKINGSSNIDWEDISIGSGPTENEYYIYIGDFGDNGHSRKNKSIYRIIEPSVDSSQNPIDTVLDGVTHLIFQYPEGKKYNAESLMIDPLNNDVYVVLKDDITRVFMATKPDSFHWVPDWIVDTLEVVDTLVSRSKANAADISDSGKEILIKDDDFVYHWYRDSSESVAEALKRIPKVLPYIKEPNGEGICWAPDSSGYYTFSEGAHPHLYFYPRIVTSIESQNIKPIKFSLEQNYPNPFNPSTTIKYSIPSVTHPLIPSREGKERSDRGVLLTLKVYDILGREVATLVNEVQKPGDYEVKFNASNLTSGIYFYRLTSSNFTKTMKMILLK